MLKYFRDSLWNLFLIQSQRLSSVPYASVDILGPDLRGWLSGGTLVHREWHKLSQHKSVHRQLSPQVSTQSSSLRIELPPHISSALELHTGQCEQSPSTLRTT